MKRGRSPSGRSQTRERSSLAHAKRAGKADKLCFLCGVASSAELDFMYLALRSFVHEDFTGLWPHVSAQSRFVTGKRKRIVLSYSCESACRMTIQKIGIRYRAHRGDKVRGLSRRRCLFFNTKKFSLLSGQRDAHLCALRCPPSQNDWCAEGFVPRFARREVLQDVTFRKM